MTTTKAAVSPKTPAVAKDAIALRKAEHKDELSAQMT